MRSSMSFSSSAISPENPDLALAECWYWIRKLQARFFAGDYAAAVEAASRAQQLLWTSPSRLRNGGISLLRRAVPRRILRRRSGRTSASSIVEALAAHHRQLQIWAANCPENFENRAALVGAEIARIEGRDARRRCASTNRPSARPAPTALSTTRRSPTNWPRASTRRVASRRLRRVYLQDARYGYLRWGADGKVRQLDQLYPQLRQEEPAPAPTSTIGAPVEHLDLATVIKVSQAVSGEIVLEKLLDTLMRTAIEQAGAERGLLILPRGAEQRIEAEATTSGDTVIVRLRDEAVTGTVLPESVLHYVLRTREGVILDDAAAESHFCRGSLYPSAARRAPFSACR